ncbi:MAG: hypothetical protein HQK60_13915 [Deltaproteobacteria bacterium]|nr:hypothetical protein [Deltaproteobacteria bacterium]
MSGGKISQDGILGRGLFVMIFIIIKMPHYPGHRRTFEIFRQNGIEFGGSSPGYPALPQNLLNRVPRLLGPEIAYNDIHYH